MSVELPKDAKGREIPLDVEFLYNANGESFKPYSFTFNRYDGFGWGMHLVGAPNLVYDPESYYLTPPDSWEKLLDDLDKDENICGYFEKCPAEMHGKSCSYCNKAALKNIASRIRKLRGED